MSGALTDPSQAQTPDPGTAQPSLLGNIWGALQRFGQGGATNPGLMALAGMSGGLAQAAMPTPYRGGVPFGAALGMSAQGGAQGAASAIRAQQEQAQAAGQNISNVANASALPLTLARNKMMTDLYNNPSMIQNLMGATMAPPPGGANPSAASPSLMGNALSSIPDPKLRAMAFNTAVTNGMSAPESAAWVSAIHNESGWNPSVPDNKNQNGTIDVGLGGVNSSNFGKLGLTADQLRDPQTNLAASAKLFHQAWQAGGREPGPALTAYNAGSPTATPTPGYVPNGLSRLGQWGYGGAADPGQNAAAMTQYYEQKAASTRLAQQLGLPVAGDPAVWDEAAKQWRGLALAGPQAQSEAAAKAGVELQTAGPIALAQARAKGAVDVATAGPIAAAQAQAKLGPELAQQGFRMDQNGNMQFIPGSKADPAVVGRQAAAEAAAKANVELNTAGPIAYQKMLNTPQDIRQGGEVRVPDGKGGFTTIKNPNIEEATDPTTGAKVYGHVTPPDPNAPPGTPGQFVPIVGPDGKPMVAGLATTNQSFMHERGTQLAEQFNKIDSDAAAAKDSNYLFDNMRNDAQTWEMGKFASFEGDARAWLSAVAHSFGNEHPELDKPLADYQAFNKSSGQLLRAAVRETSARAAVQEYNLIGDSLPQPTTSPQAFGQVADQWQGLNDFRLAKQKFAQNYQNNPQQFNVDFNSQVSPTAFMLNRMAQSPTGQQDMQSMVANLQKTSTGRAQLAHLMEGYQFARSHGLFDNLPPSAPAPGGP